MAQSSEPNNSIERAARIAAFLDEHGASDPLALDISQQSSFADAFVIAGASSNAQMRGLQRQLEELLTELGLSPRTRPRRSDESGWLVIDCNEVIIHLMLAEQRSFYELERLWFDAQQMYPEPAAGS